MNAPVYPPNLIKTGAESNIRLFHGYCVKMKKARFASEAARQIYILGVHTGAAYKI
jgi:hypothetical protein